MESEQWGNRKREGTEIWGKADTPNKGDTTTIILCQISIYIQCLVARF